MAQDATLHVKLSREADAQLKELAYRQGKSKGQLVREALTACYQPEVEQLPLNQRQALAAYQGGFISLGKLARTMGLHELELRQWLGERGIAQMASYASGDADHA